MSEVIEIYVKTEYMPVQADYSSFATEHAARKGVTYKKNHTKSSKRGR